MVGDKVEDKAQSALVQAFAQAGESAISTEVCVDMIVTDCEAGTGDVVFLEVGEEALIFRQPLRIRG
jgi:hypothetical protein